MEQTERDIALTLQRDYRTFDLKKTTELSTRTRIYEGWTYTKGAALNTVAWTSGSEVGSAFRVLSVLITQLAKGTYQASPPVSRANPGIWPVDSIDYSWIRALYAYLNPAYATWATTNGLQLPPGTAAWATAWQFSPGF